MTSTIDELEPRSPSVRHVTRDVTRDRPVTSRVTADGTAMPTALPRASGRRPEKKTARTGEPTPARALPNPFPGEGEELVTNRTDESRRPTKPEVIFMCEYCGASRASRTLARSARLKCSACGLTTEHILAGVRDESGLNQWHHADWREDANGRETAKLRKAVFIERFLTASGVEIDDNLPSNKLHQDGKRYLYSVTRDRRDGDDCWVVEVANDATLDGRIAALQEAARHILCDERFQEDEEYIGWSFTAPRPACLREKR